MQNDDTVCLGHMLDMARSKSKGTTQVESFRLNDKRRHRNEEPRGLFLVSRERIADTPPMSLKT